MWNHLAHDSTVPVSARWALLGRATKVSGRKDTKPDADELHVWLSAQPTDRLVELIWDQAQGDDRFRDQLLMQAATQRVGGLNLAPFIAAIDRATAVSDFVDYAEAYSYSSGIRELLTNLEQLLRDGQAAAVIELAEHAHRSVEENLESVDDSDGYLGGLLDHIEELHLAACRKARPDPEDLAHRLLALEKGSDYGFSGAAQTYARVLGKKGLAAYRRLAEEEWAKIPALGPGDPSGGSGERGTITRIMEALARESGDVEAQVAITSRDLTSPRSFLQIAEFYREAGRAADALAWAEQGMAAFPTGEHPGLTTFVVDAYLDGGRNREAMELAWEGFARHPGFAAFQQLKARADRAGQWDQWRARARTLLRQQATPMTQTTYREARWARGYSELVQALLWDEEPDMAWREAVAGGCTDEVWLQLAAIREQEHPEDVIPVYRRLAERLVQEKNNDAYRRAAAIVKGLGGVMVGLGRGEEFSAYLVSLRKAHRPKRNFMAALSADGL
jgi:hypothetical protein